MYKYCKVLDDLFECLKSKKLYEKKSNIVSQFEVASSAILSIALYDRKLRKRDYDSLSNLIYKYLQTIKKF